MKNIDGTHRMYQKVSIGVRSQLFDDKRTERLFCRFQALIKVLVSCICGSEPLLANESRRR